ncbi:MAG: hypothetical protein ABI261_02920 [Ginsengibacter sp.]
MKYYFLILSFIVSSHVGLCKKYVIIDLNQPSTNEVILGNGSTNLPNAKIFLYNKWIQWKNETFLITASILPDIINGEIKFDSLTNIPKEYEIVDMDKIAIKSINYYLNNCNKLDSKYPLKTTKFTAIIKKKNKYFIALSNTCLLEFYKYSQATPFSIQDYDYITLYPYGTPYSRNDVLKIKEYLHSNFKGDLNDLGKVMPFGKPENIYGQKEFSFWITLPPAFDIGWQYFGIEDFKLIPDIGIVAGSFRQYLKGGTGSVINTNFSHFEQNTKLFTAISINGHSLKEFLKEINTP